MNLTRFLTWPGRWLAQARQNWKSHALTLLTFLLVYVGIHQWQTRSIPDGPAPTFSAPVIGPQTSGLIDLERWRQAHAGRAVALHFWAEWCPICRAEEGSISQLQAHWPVLGVAMQSGDAARVRGVLDKRQLDWTTAVDVDGQIARRFGLSSVPAFIVIDAQGRIRFAEVGYTTEAGMRLRLWWAQTF
jgi:thiol-disulfide isomerase/thioredoxin